MLIYNYVKRTCLLDEEVLYYFIDEWEDSKKEWESGIWLTTRALLLKLQGREVITTWPTLEIRLQRLLNKGEIEQINTSVGMCWRPKDGNNKDTN